MKRDWSVSGPPGNHVTFYAVSASGFGATQCAGTMSIASGPLIKEHLATGFVS